VNRIFNLDTAPLLEPGSPVMDRVVRAASDLALRLSPTGEILDLHQEPSLSVDPLDHWVGSSWADSVAPDSRTKALQVLEEARSQGISRTRQINQRVREGTEIPIGYTAVLLDRDLGFLVLGRNLQPLSDLQRRLVEAQQALERDYWRLRQVETRYRLLFQRSAEAVLVLDADSLRVLDANRSAGRVFAVAPRKLSGRVFPDEMGLGRGAIEEIRRHLTGVRDFGRAETASLLLGGGEEWRLDATLVREERDGILLVHLFPVEALGSAASAASRGTSLAHLLEHSPDAYVLADREARILMTNRAFRALIQVPTEEELTGQSLGRWLGRPGADLTVLLTNLEKFGEVRLFPTTLNSALELESEVELSATMVAEMDPPAIGITIRNVSRRIWAEQTSAPHRDLSRAVEQLTDQVGKVSLKQLVQDTVAVVEAHFIESALKLTDGNRTAAAEILGVSRQSLYTKLRRYDVNAPDA